MKKLVTTLAFSLGMLALMSSCGKEQKKIIPETASQDVNRHNLMAHAREFNEYTLDDMRTYSVDMQREIFAEMVPDNQARIWQERVEDAISKATEQGGDASFIAGMKGLEPLITAELYDKGTNGAAIDDWAEKNMAVAGYEKIKDLLTTLGGSVEPSEAPGNGGGGGGGTTAPSTIGCNCSQSHDYCGGVNTSTGKCSGMRSCSASSHGCGNLWLNTCNGICVDIYVPHD